MMTSADAHGELLSRVPVWNGHPETFPAFEDEIELYILGENLDVKVSLAARVAQKLRGASRRIALSMKRDLFPLSNSGSEDGAGGRRKLPPRTSEQANRVGLKRLLERLRSDLQPGKQDLKGEKLHVFFGTTKLYRRRG